MTTLKQLRRHAIAQSLSQPSTLRRAIERLGFVQADPIRAPARAQDLILRARVKDYRVGDLDAQYKKLELEEDFLYAYGFMPRSTWRLLHPRAGHRRLGALEKRILEIASEREHLHPRELESELGSKRLRNDWGGHSQAATLALQSLHYHGLLRVAKRQNGIRVYQKVATDHEPLDPVGRLRQLVLLTSSILGPVPETSLRTTVAHEGRAAPVLKGRFNAVSALLKSGELASVVADGIRYVYPDGRLKSGGEAEPVVRFLAPFDPVVWDRRRFEHFWNWPYRFEAYTPVHKRQLGYYALPMLWRDDVIGWVNISNRGDGIEVEPGFKKDKPSDSRFAAEFDAEVERFRRFLETRR